MSIFSLVLLYLMKRRHKIFYLSLLERLLMHILVVKNEYGPESAQIFEFVHSA
jgi:hypothetical protein